MQYQNELEKKRKCNLPQIIQFWNSEPLEYLLWVRSCLRIKIPSLAHMEIGYYFNIKITKEDFNVYVAWRHWLKLDLFYEFLLVYVYVYIRTSHIFHYYLEIYFVTL